MKLRILILLTVALCAAAQAKGKPNVLFIMSDDLNTSLSGYGHPECKTPNLDKFAKSGVSFSRAYCQFPLCGPSRASIMSGQYPVIGGVTRNGGAVDPDRITLPRHFGNHDYWTARVSKIYHMGIPGDIMEGTSGKDHAPSWMATHNIMAMETLTPGKIADYASPKAPEVFPKERKIWQEAHDQGKPYEMQRSARGQYAVVEVADEDTGLMADSMTADKTIKLLQQRAKNETPFFLAVGFVRPHFPFIATDETIAPYDADKLKYPAFPKNDFDDMPPQAVRDRKAFSEQAVKEMRRGYFGAVTFMDKQFGRLMDELDRLKLRENTIVVFVSDHGYLIGEHEMYKKAKLWEEAIHVPLIISAPGMKGGVTCNRFVELIDLYPTITELAGLPTDPGCQGLSLASLLKNPKAKRPEKPDALIQVSAGFGLRSGKWAYMYYPKRNKDPEAAMLYDMTKDPEQFTNLATAPKHARSVKRLHDRLTERIATARSQP